MGGNWGQRRCGGPERRLQSSSLTGRLHRLNDATGPLPGHSGRGIGSDRSRETAMERQTRRETRSTTAWALVVEVRSSRLILVVVQRFFDAGSRARPNIPPPPGPAQNQPLDFFQLLSSFSPLSFSNHALFIQNGIRKAVRCSCM